MVNIYKIKTNCAYKFEVEINDDIFYIEFLNNLDLYWYTNFKNDSSCVQLIITKENMYLYNLIDLLFLEAKSCSKLDSDFPYFFNDTLYYYSDEDMYDCADFLSIEKKDDYIIKFNKSLSKSNLDWYTSIRIRNNGSRYKNLNVPFMKMYNDLIENVDEYHQISIDEYVYRKFK